MTTRFSERICTLALTILCLAGTSGDAFAQGNTQSVGVSFLFQGYDFNDDLGADVVNLLLIPIAYRLPIGERFTADLYAAWAEGRVERDNQIFVLNGAVDTRLHFSYQASPWAIITVGVNLPTGNVTHDNDEATVASVLSSDLLGFRESNWGTGGYVTTGVATARRFGAWGLGLGASYRATDDFEPRSDTTLAYSPGNEFRVRLGVDRNVGETGKLTGGVTLQSYASDQFGGRNLFQSGNRFRADAAYAFRAGSSTWNLSVADSWRDNGDLNLQIINGAGDIVGDSAVTTITQNLFFASVNGAIPIGSTLYLRPIVDFRFQDMGFASGEVESQGGWIVGGGFDLPVRLLGVDVFPRAKVNYGRLKSADGSSVRVIGLEASGTLRFR